MFVWDAYLKCTVFRYCDKDCAPVFIVKSLGTNIYLFLVYLLELIWICNQMLLCWKFSLTTLFSCDIWNICFSGDASYFWQALLSNLWTHFFRSALEQKKIEEEKFTQEIDYDAPIDSGQKSVGIGTKVKHTE